MALGNGDIVRVGAVFEDGLGSEMVNVFHVALTTVAADQAQIRDDIVEWLEDLYGAVLNRISDTIDTKRIELYNVSEDLPEIDLDWVGGLTFGGSGDPVASGVCALVIGRTAVKRKVGRKFLPPFANALLNSGRWTTLTIADMNTFGSRWLDSFVATNGTTITGGVFGVDTGIFSTIVQAVGTPIPAYQRRRREGRGS